MVFAFRLAFRYEVHHTAYLAYGKHYIAFMTMLTTHIKTPTQKPVYKNNREGESEHNYLAALGERVREARARRGMSRKLLARDSEVSERYLAQLESGHGNVSILLLRQIATALNLSLTELLAEDSGDAVELTLTTQFLKRLPRQTLAAVRSQLARDYATPPDEPMNPIPLTGLPAPAKSTPATKLAP